MLPLPKPLRDGLRLRCPRCGEKTVFEGLFRMRETCPECGLLFEKEPGYFVGAIYINYGVTVGLAVGGFFLLEWGFAPPLSLQLALWGAFAAACPILFHRHSKSLWLNLDHHFSAPALPRAPRGE